MKSKIYLTALFLLFLSCKENDQKNSIEAPILANVVQENEIWTETSDGTSINIKDIFLLLPDDALPMQGMSINNRKLLLKHIGEQKAFDISQTPIDICDIKNGYLSLTGMQFGWEMCYWNKKDGSKLVAVNSGTESGSEIRSFLYQNGQLIENHNDQLGGNQKYKLADFIDVSQLSKATRNFAEKQFAKGAYQLYYQLPQKGTSLKISLDTDHLIDYNESYEIPQEAIKEVTLKWKNEMWEK